jgi:radical SAM superfamily enzyme YgiQ (UPF0313 family)
MRLTFIYPAFKRHAQAHPELLDCVPCNEYFGPPSLGIAYLAAVTPPSWEISFFDDRIEKMADLPEANLYAISTFTPSAVRAMEIADILRESGAKVVMGGIFPTLMTDEVLPHCDAVVAGEGEGVWPRVLADAEAGTLGGVYRADEPVDLATLPRPRIDLYLDKESEEYHPDDYPLQQSRGCPVQCEACVVPLTMGRKMRFYPPEHVIETARLLGSRGKFASFTEDTAFMMFSGARRRFKKLLRAFAETEGVCKISYTGVSMPMLLVVEDETFSLLRDAGVNMFYLVGGFDQITKKAFLEGNDKELGEAKEVIARCHEHGITPYTSFLVGHDEDDPGVFERIVRFANETGIERAEFAIYTPYPGTPAWDRLQAQGRIITRDWSLFNDANVTFRPALMSDSELLDGYLYLWKEFYKTRQDLRDEDRTQKTIQF